MSAEWSPRRPWCLPCREITGTLTWAEVLGICCPSHFDDLSEPEQAALVAAVRKFHPRGGSVKSVLGQIGVVRMGLRDTTVYATWKAERWREPRP